MNANEQIYQFAMQLMARNPNFANNSQAMHMLEVIRSGNSVEGRKIAENLLTSYGVSKEEGIQQAKSFFHIQ